MAGCGRQNQGGRSEEGQHHTHARLAHAGGGESVRGTVSPFTHVNELQRDQNELEENNIILMRG